MNKAKLKKLGQKEGSEEARLIAGWLKMPIKKECAGPPEVTS